MAAVLVYNACCISKLRIFLFYGHPWVPLCPDKGDLTVSLAEIKDEREHY